MTRGRKAALLLLAALALAAHVALLGSFLQWRRLAEPKVYAYGDYSIHYMDGLQVGGFLQREGRLWGWSPFFFAGYPAGIFDAPSNRGTGLMFFVFGTYGTNCESSRDWLPSPRMVLSDPPILFKLYVFLLLALVPPVIGVAASEALGVVAGSLATVAAVFYFQLERIIFVFCRYGMFHFLFACSLTVLAIVIHDRLVSRPRPLMAVLSGLVLGAVLFVHPASPVLLAPGLLVIHVRPGRKRHAHVAGAAALGIAAVLSLPWAVPLARNFAYAGADSGFWSTDQVSLVNDLVVSTDHIARNVIVLVMLAGLWAGSRAQLPLVVSALAALSIGLVGSRLPILDRLEPARFTIPAGLFAILPAVAGLEVLRSNARVLRATAIAAALLVLVPLVGSGRASRVVSELAYGETEALCEMLVPNLLLWTMPLEERPEAEAIVRTLELQATEGRVAIEQDWAGSRLQGFLASYVRLRLDRLEQLGGPHPFVKVRENGLNFFDGFLAGKRIEEWSDGDLLSFCDRYDVAWVVARKPKTVAELRRRARAGFLEIMAEGTGFIVLRTGIVPSRFLEGSGVARASYDRIEVHEASQGTVVLKYHFHPQLECLGPDRVHRLPLERVDVPGDPDGFIRVRNGDSRSFTVQTKGNPIWPF